MFQLSKLILQNEHCIIIMYIIIKHNALLHWRLVKDIDNSLGLFFPTFCKRGFQATGNPTRVLQSLSLFYKSASWRHWSPNCQIQDGRVLLKAICSITGSHRGISAHIKSYRKRKRLNFRSAYNYASSRMSLVSMSACVSRLDTIIMKYNV